MTRSEMKRCAQKQIYEKFTRGLQFDDSRKKQSVL